MLKHFFVTIPGLEDSMQSSILGSPPSYQNNNIETIISQILSIQSTNKALNFYLEEDSINVGDRPGDATKRLENLRHYLYGHWTASHILVGEAPGYQGARFSGIPFTSQYLLYDYGRKEPSASIVWKTLRELKIENKVILWNSFLLHPHNEKLLSNRRPTTEEIFSCNNILSQICQDRIVVPIGKIAELATKSTFCIRHPAYGGAILFKEGLKQIFY